MSTTPHSINDREKADNRFSRRKRGLKPDSPETPIITSAAKKQKPAKMATNDQLISLITSMKTDIENKIITSQSSIESKLNDLATNVNVEVQNIKTSINDFKSELSTEITALKGQITEHAQRLNNNDDDINRLKLIADLRIIGVQFKQNENLVELFTNYNRIRCLFGNKYTDN